MKVSFRPHSFLLFLLVLANASFRRVMSIAEAASCGEQGTCQWFEECDEATITCLTKEACVPSETSCSFYLDCLEMAIPCGEETGYALGTGIPACERVAEREAGFSPSAQEWSLKTRHCLQQSLLVNKQETDLSAMSCEEIMDFALSTHVGCYKESGFCDLSFWDYLKITRALNGVDTNIPEEKEEESMTDLLDACLPPRVICRSVPCFLIRSFFRSLWDWVTFWN